jgi:Cu/Ag efflux protein CusF
MWNFKRIDGRALVVSALVLAHACFALALAGCGSSPKPPAAQPQAQSPQRFSLNGRVVSVDKAKQQVVVDAAEIPGFMMAMTMGYAVKNPNQLEPLSPDEQITADVVVNGSDVYLENIKAAPKADQSKTPAAPPAKQ